MTSFDDTSLLAHGVGGRQDLPIPAHYAFIGGALALIVSFAVLAVAWRTSRFRGDESGRPLWGWLAAFVESRIIRGALVLGSLLFAAWVTMAALFGTDTLINPAFGVVFVLLWVGLVPAALLFGPIYRLCNPLRWVHRGICRLIRIDPREGLYEYPARLGLWPAAATLFGFVWLELANPGYTTDLTFIVMWFALLGVVLVLGAALFGDVWFARADPFEVYSSLVARLSPFGRRTDGVLVVRNPLENLDGTPPLPGLAAVVAVLFGSTGFDSFKDSSRWLSFAQQHTEHQTLLNSAALLGFCLVVLVTFSAAAVATGGLGHVRRKAMPRLLAHSIVPIVVGYIVAHYLSFYVAVGIQTLQQLGDPLSRGWPLGDWVEHIDKYWIYEHPTGLAVVKVIAVITGHILGAVAAHDRAVRLLPRRHAIVGQLPMLVLMVVYTFTGLWLLFSS